MAKSGSNESKTEFASQPAQPASQDSGDTDVSGSVQEVQARMDEITEQGYQGVSADPTPNSAYTVAGVTSGAPTPETDKAQAAAVREHQEQLGSDLSGPSGK